MRRKFIAGNWKMNGSCAFVDRYSSEFKNALLDVQNSAAMDVALFVPSLYLGVMTKAVSPANCIVGAQNVSEFEEGAYTGELAATMLRDSGVEWTLVGHSERRTLFGETDEVAVAKVKAAVSAGLNVVFCVGETLEERESGLVDQVIERQVNAVFRALPIDMLSSVVIAYEPVWAIGTGKTATPEQAQEVHKMIREVVSGIDGVLGGSLRIIYGGSVKPDNAGEIFSKPDVDGGLVGGASLSVDGFINIIRAAGE